MRDRAATRTRDTCGGRTASTSRYYGDPAIPVPVKMDHTHSFVPDINACKDWYQKVLGGVPGQRPRVSSPGWNEVVHFPGMTVTFAGSQAGAALAPTQGRSLDHMGFEVKDLDAYRQEARGSRHQARFGPATDPWHPDRGRLSDGSMGHTHRAHAEPRACLQEIRAGA